MSSFLSSFIEMIVPKIHAEEEEDEPEAEEEAAEEEAAEEEAAEEEEEEEEDEEDLVDPHDTIREQCVADHCASIKARLDECNARVESKNSTTETCFEEILDFYHCIDHCSSKIIMSKLK
jgi:ubiquinol-cytochrome c reductase subunit 6